MQVARKRVAAVAIFVALSSSSAAFSSGISIYGPPVSELSVRADAIFTGTVEGTVQVVARETWAISRTRIRVESWYRGGPHETVLVYHHTQGDGLRGPDFRFSRKFAPGERVLIFAEHKRLLQRREPTFLYAADFASEPQYAIYLSVNGRGAGFAFTLLEGDRIGETWHAYRQPKTLVEAIAEMQPYLDSPEPRDGLQARLIHFSKGMYGLDIMYLELRNVGDEAISLDSYAYPDDAFLEVLDPAGRLVSSTEAFGYRRKWKERKPPSLGDIQELRPGDTCTYITDNPTGLGLRPGPYRVRYRLHRVHREPHLPGTIFAGEFTSNSVPFRVE